MNLFVCDSCGKQENSESCLRYKQCSCGGEMALIKEQDSVFKGSQLSTNISGPSGLVGSIAVNTIGSIKPEKTLKRYKACICPHCHEVQMTGEEGHLTCCNCGKRTKFRKQGKKAIVYFDFDSPQKASIITKKIKEIAQANPWGIWKMSTKSISYGLLGDKKTGCPTKLLLKNDS